MMRGGVGAGVGGVKAASKPCCLLLDSPDGTAEVRCPMPVDHVDQAVEKQPQRVCDMIRNRGLEGRRRRWWRRWRDRQMLLANPVGLLSQAAQTNRLGSQLKRASDVVPIRSQPHDRYETGAPLCSLACTLQWAHGKRGDVETEAPVPLLHSQREVVTKRVAIRLSEAAVVGKDASAVPYCINGQPRI